MTTKRMVTIQGASREIELKVGPNGEGYISVDYVILAKTRTGKAVQRQQLRLNSKFQVLTPVFLNRQGIIVGWVDQFELSVNEGCYNRIKGLSK